MDRRRFLHSGIAVAATFATGAQAQTASRLKVVATFSILADMVRQIGGDLVDVISLVGADGDVHSFQPTPSDASKIAAAQLVVTNGLGLEGWLDRLITASGGKPKIVVATTDIKPRIDTPDKPDPHAWQNVDNARQYIAAIQAGLAAQDLASAHFYQNQAEIYLKILGELDLFIRTAIQSVPAQRRRIITTHDALGYYGDAYGLKIMAPIGLSTETEPGAKAVATLITQIRTNKVPAVFLENISDPRLMLTIARESGAKIGGTLYDDALSPPDGPAPNYIEMMRYNTATIVSALKE